MLCTGIRANIVIPKEEEDTTLKKPVVAEKNYMRAEEAVQLYGLSRRKFNALLKEGGHDFVAYYGRRRLILRERFESYLDQPGIKEALKKKWEKSS